MKIKVSLKSILMVLLIVNSQCIDLAKLKSPSNHANRKSTQKIIGKGIPTKLPEKIRFLSRRNKTKKTSEVISNIYSAFLITTSVDSIATIITGYASAKEALIKNLKSNGLATLAIMYEEVKMLKSGLCSNVRNTNFFFFDYISFTLLDLYFRRAMAMKVFHFDILKSDKKSKSLRLSSLKVKAKGLINLKSEEIAATKLIPFDQMSQNLFEVKQQMKDFQNTICAINDNAIGEMTYIAARAGGLTNALTQSSEGSFFMIANLILDFSTVFANLGLQAARSTQAEVIKYHELKTDFDFEDETKFMEEFGKRKQELSSFGIDINPSEYLDLQTYRSTTPPFLLDPLKFISDLKDNMLKIYPIYKIFLKSPKDDDGKDINRMEIFKPFFDNLVALVISFFLLSKFAQFVRKEIPSSTDPTQTEEIGFSRAALGAARGSVFTTYVPLLFSLQNALISLKNLIFGYIDWRNAEIKKEGVVKMLQVKADFYIERQKFIFHIFKLAFYIALDYFLPYIFMGILKFVQLLVKLFANAFGENLQSAAMMAMNVFLFLKITISISKVVLSVLRWVKANRELKIVKADFSGEQKIRNNFLQNLRIQAIFVTFRHNTLIYSTFSDILKFYEVISNPYDFNVNINPEAKSKKLEDLTNEQITDLYENTNFEGVMQNIRDNTNLWMASPSRYNNLKVHRFFLKFCQENETFCINYLSPKILKDTYKLRDEYIETIFKFVYNDLVAGPISDIFVATPYSTTLSIEYLVKNNFKFYKNEKDFGPDYAILYRRCGNANNYLVDFEFNSIELPAKFVELFDKENAFKKKTKDLDKGKANSHIYTFFTSDNKSEEINITTKKTENYNRNYVMIKMMTAIGTDSLRGDRASEAENYKSKRETDISKTQFTLLTSFNPESKDIYNFVNMYFSSFQGVKCLPTNFFKDCFYLFSKVEGEKGIPFGNILEFQNELKAMDTYVNSCFSNTKISLSVVKLQSDTKIKIFTCSINQDVVTHLSLFDKRYYTIKKECSNSFQMIDSRMVKIHKHYLNSSEQYLESQIKCFKENKEQTDDEIEFFNESQTNLLKSNINSIQIAVCTSYELFKNKDKLEADSMCTRVNENEDFNKIGTFYCEGNIEGIRFFEQIRGKYNINFESSLNYKYKPNDDDFMNNQYYIENKLLPPNLCSPKKSNLDHYILFFKNSIPRLNFFTDMTITKEGKNFSLFLLRHNTQFFDKDNLNQNIPNFKTMNNLVYNTIIEGLVGAKSGGRNGGIFHMVFPVTRLAELKDEESEEKVLEYGNIVFKVDKLLTNSLREIVKVAYPNGIVTEKVYPKVNGAIFKLEIIRDKNNSKQNKYFTESEPGNAADPNTIPLSPIKLEYAPMAKRFYVEFNMFKEISWYNFLDQDYKLAMNLRGLEFLISACFLIYWPPFEQDQKPTSYEFLKDFKAVQPEATVNYYIPFMYSPDWTLMSRIWVKFDYYFQDDHLDVICQSQFGVDAEEKKKKVRKHLISKRSKL